MLIAWRGCDPQILTDLNPYGESLHLVAAKQLPGSKGYGLAPVVYPLYLLISPLKMAGLIKLRIVWQVHLGHQPQQLSI